jgi:hypothetical protein
MTRQVGVVHHRRHSFEEYNRVDWRSTQRCATTAKQRWEREIATREDATIDALQTLNKRDVKPTGYDLADSTSTLWPIPYMIIDS